jgi:DNA-binding NarL/FixJ family response regulator
MPAPTIVIAQSDPGTEQGLAKDLHAHFARIAVAKSKEELRTMLLRQEVRAAVLDLEIVSLKEVRELAGDFDDLAIICTHRSPDDRMWMDALNAGADEFCHPGDLHSILHAARGATARRNLQLAA